MSRDYKPRDQDKKNGLRRQKYGKQQPKIALWKWMLIVAITISFVVFLVYLKTMSIKPINIKQSSQTIENKVTADHEKNPEVKLKPKGPQFDFYTILPDKEVVVPEYEIKTRVREERVGKAKEAHYMMQAGSFKTAKEADNLRIKLASMGIESKVQKGKVGSVNWYRVKLGPFAQADSISAIRSRLRQNNVDVVITENSE
jgi:cell division protein FtsN